MHSQHVHLLNDFRHVITCVDCIDMFSYHVHLFYIFRHVTLKFVDLGL